MKKPFLLSFLLIGNVANCTIGETYSNASRATRDFMEQRLPDVYSDDAHRSEILAVSVIFAIALAINNWKHDNLKEKVCSLEQQLESLKAKQQENSN